MQHPTPQKPKQLLMALLTQLQMSLLHRSRRELLPQLQHIRQLQRLALQLLGRAASGGVLVEPWGQHGRL